MATLGEFGGIIHQIDKRLSELEMKRRGDGWRSGVNGFMVEIVCECDAISRVDGQDLVLNVTIEGDEANRGFSGARELVCEINAFLD